MNKMENTANMPPDECQRKYLIYWSQTDDFLVLEYHSHNISSTQKTKIGINLGKLAYVD